MEEMMRWQIPAFGNWEYYYDDMPITHNFDYISQAGLIPPCYFAEEDLFFKVPVAMPVKYAYPCGDHCRRKARKVSGVGERKHNKKVQEQRKEEGICNATATPRRRAAPMAVDEDLYKIPPELLYPKPKRKKVLRNLLTGCMGIGCIR